MAKIREAQVAGLPVKTLRRLVGIPAHRPSAFASCVGEKLKDKLHPPAPIGAGGRRNVGWQKMFVEAARNCSQQVPKAPKTRKTPTPVA